MHTITPSVSSLALSPVVDKYDVSSLKSISCAGSYLDLHIAIACRERLQLRDLRQSDKFENDLSWKKVSCSFIRSLILEHESSNDNFVL